MKVYFNVDSEKTSEVKDKLSCLSIEERNYVLYSMLYENKISFAEIANMYLETLEDKEKRNRDTIHGLSIPLQYYVENERTCEKQDKFMENKAKYHMLKSKAFAETGYEKQLEKDVEESGYTEY